MAYLPLSTANLPDPVIDPAQGASPEDYFGAVTYTGNGGTLSVPVGFAPDFTWIKNRSNSYNHRLYDIIRGDSIAIQSNQTNAEASYGAMSFESDGFAFTNDSQQSHNTNGDAYISWNWKANGSGVSNTDGSITSTVSANTTSGFSIVSYTGTGNNSGNIGHGLGVKPSLIIHKNRNNTGNWNTYTDVIDGSRDFLYLNLTNAKGDSGAPVPTDTVFQNYDGGTTDNFIAYCFASVEGFSKIGSYIGNGSTDGPFVYTGFRPAWILWKRTDAAQEWHIMDVERNTYNPLGKDLWPPHSSAEYDYGTVVDYTSNGFKLRTSSVIANASGGTYIYMAFAENPFKYSNAR